MRAIRIIILVAGMAALLAGCQSAKDQEKTTTLDCFVLRQAQQHPRNDGRTDSPALTGTPSQRGMDSIKEYYERMERWEMLHGGMSRWESDK